jgi:hypothetical protein
MTTANALVREYFGPLDGLPCWHVTAEYGSWLSFRFGQPHLDVREGAPESKTKRLKRRRVFVEGTFLLWVEMGAWEILEDGKRLFHSEQSRRYLRRAAAHLEAQKVQQVTLVANPISTVFSFDFGSELRIRPTEDAESDEPLWHLYTQKRCLSLLASGTLEHGLSANSKPRRIAARSTVYAV